MEAILCCGLGWMGDEKLALEGWEPGYRNQLVANVQTYD